MLREILRSCKPSMLPLVATGLTVKATMELGGRGRDWGKPPQNLLCLSRFQSFQGFIEFISTLLKKLMLAFFFLLLFLLLLWSGFSDVLHQILGSLAIHSPTFDRDDVQGDAFPSKSSSIFMPRIVCARNVVCCTASAPVTTTAITDLCWASPFQTKT